MKARLGLALTGVVGFALTLWLVFHAGVRDILDLLWSAGWGLAWLIPLHGAALVLNARGWQVLLQPGDPQRHGSLPFLWWIASVREAVSCLLPIISVGGDVVGIRLALLRPLPSAAVVASVLIEILLTVASLFVFSAIGLLLLLSLLPANDTTNALLAGLAIALPAPMVMYFVLRNGHLSERFHRGVARILGADHAFSIRLADSAVSTDRDLRQMLRQPILLTRALGWQLAGMILASAETWLALALLGQPALLWKALVLESLSITIRNFVFFVPAGVGVQEASLVVIGGLVGLPVDVSLALAVTKRLRDMGFGVPALLSWMLVEGHRLRHRPPTPLTDC